MKTLRPDPIPPGYKQTEVGVIPEEWRVKPLGSVLSKGRLGGNYANQDAEAELPLMKMGNLARGYFDLSKVQFITPGVQPELVHRLGHGDVLFNTRNTLDLVGKVAIWRDELPVAYYNSNLMRLEFDPEQVCSNEYANYSLNMESAVSRLRALATGTTSVAAIYTRDLMKLQVLVPPRPEQRAIATALSDVDALLGGLDRLIAKKCDLKQAAMQQLLTGQTRLPGFHGEWEVKTLRECARFCSGTYLAQDAYRDGEFEVQGAGSQMGKHIAANFPEPVSVIGRVGTVGRPRFMPVGCWVNNNAAAIIALPGKATPSFAHLLLMTMDWSKATSVTAQPFLVIESLMKMEFQIPPVPEQTAIAEVLTEMDRELAALEQRREKTRALKQAMMQELLTGRTRLV